MMDSEPTWAPEFPVWASTAPFDRSTTLMKVVTPLRAATWAAALTACDGV